MNCCHETQCIFGKLNFVGHYFPLSVPDCSITRAGRMFRTALLRFKRGAADEVTFEIIRRLGSWIRDLTTGAAGDLLPVLPPVRKFIKSAMNRCSHCWVILFLS